MRPLLNRRRNTHHLTPTVGGNDVMQPPKSCTAVLFFLSPQGPKGDEPGHGCDARTDRYPYRHGVQAE